MYIYPEMNAMRQAVKNKAMYIYYIYIIYIGIIWSSTQYSWSKSSHVEGNSLFIMHIQFYAFFPRHNISGRGIAIVRTQLTSAATLAAPPA